MQFLVAATRSVGNGRRGWYAKQFSGLARIRCAACGFAAPGLDGARGSSVVSSARVLIGRVGRRHVCMLELRRRRPDVRTLAPGNAFAHRSRAVDATRSRARASRITGA
jgi:hypothetical protein